MRRQRKKRGSVYIKNIFEIISQQFKMEDLSSQDQSRKVMVQGLALGLTTFCFTNVVFINFRVKCQVYGVIWKLLLRMNDCVENSLFFLCFLLPRMIREKCESHSHILGFRNLNFDPKIAKLTKIHTEVILPSFLPLPLSFPPFILFSFLRRLLPFPLSILPLTLMYIEQYRQMVN